MDEQFLTNIYRDYYQNSSLISQHPQEYRCMGERGRGRGNSRGGRGSWSGHENAFREKSYCKPSMLLDPWKPITTYLVQQGFLPPDSIHSFDYFHESHSIQLQSSHSNDTNPTISQQEASSCSLALGTADDPNELSLDDI